MAVAVRVAMVPQFRALMINLLAIAGCVVALGIVAILHRFSSAIVGGVAGALGRIPAIGRVLASPVNAVVNWMDRQFTAAEEALDRALAYFLHELGALVEWLGAELRDLAHSLYTLSANVIGAAAVTALDKVIASLRRTLTTVRALALDTWNVASWARWQINHVATGVIGAAVATMLRPIRATLTTIATQLDTFRRVITSRVGALERAVSTTIPQSIAGLRAATRALTDLYNGVNARVRRIEETLSTTGAAALVASALATLGLGWVRCSNVGKMGRAMCGMPGGLLDDVLALLVDFVILENICVLLPWLEEAAETIGAPLVAGIAGVVGAGTCGGVARSPALRVPALYLPATAGTTLHLAA